MKSDLVDVLAYPACRGERKENSVRLAPTSVSGSEEVVEGILICVGCGQQYTIQQGIPIFLPAELRGVEVDPALLSTAARQKWRQMTSHDAAYLNEDELNPHRMGALYQFLTYYQLDNAIKMFPFPFTGRRMLNICCGRGSDAEFFARQWGPVVGVDISFHSLLRAAKNAARYNFEFQGICADAENLPLKSKTFSLGFVRDGLHHLADPRGGLDELCRVCSDAILLFEPGRGWMRNLVKALGIVPAYEESGNYVFEFSERDLESQLRAWGFQHSRFRRDVFKHVNLSLFNSGVGFALARVFWMTFNKVLGRRWGTKLTALAWRGEALEQSTQSRCGLMTEGDIDDKR
jgi:SAM-dependent methyltransferase